MKKVIVVGGGLGGISTALRLLKEGYKVTIIEKNKTLGGKINRLEEKGFKFDLTASILMTKSIFLDLFKDLDKDYKNYMEIINLSSLYKVNYFDGFNFEIFSEAKRTFKELEKIKKGISKDYIKYLEKSIEKYDIVKDLFLNKEMINLREMINLKFLKKLIKLKPLENNFSYTSKIIKNDRLIEFLLFQSMYIGVNPYEGSSVYSLIPSITQIYGLIYIKGGFYAYIEALEKLLIEFGCKIIKEKEVSKIIIENKKVSGVFCDGEIIHSDIVVCNSDYQYTLENLIEKEEVKFPKIKKFEYSPSVFILYLGLKEKVNNLRVHNIFINENLEEEFKRVFKNEFPLNPPLYIYYPSFIDDSLALDGKSVMNIMVRVPNLETKINWNDKLKNDFRNIIINSLKKIEDFSYIEDIIEYEKILTPKDLENKFNLYNGAAFGISHKLSQSGYFRPSMKNKNVEGLYFIGASTHPGNGASVSINGSKVLASLIKKENPII